METAELGLALPEEIAFGEEHLVVPPPQRLADASVAPLHKGPARAARAERQRLDGDDFRDHQVRHSVDRTKSSWRTSDRRISRVNPRRPDLARHGRRAKLGSAGS